VLGLSGGRDPLQAECESKEDSNVAEWLLRRLFERGKSEENTN